MKNCCIFVLNKNIMELIKFEILYSWCSKPINNKAKEIQIDSYLCLVPEINFEINLNQQDTNIFNFIINLFNLFNLQICKTKKTDHAGFWFELSIFGLNFTYRKYDTRHWDWENDTWEVL